MMLRESRDTYRIYFIHNYILHYWIYYLKCLFTYMLVSKVIFDICTNLQIEMPRHFHISFRIVCITKTDIRCLEVRICIPIYDVER